MNKINFRKSGGKDVYEETLKTRKLRSGAMQVKGAGGIPLKKSS